MKPCPMPNCQLAIQDRMFTCRRHWTMVPNAEKEELAAVFNRYLCDEISHAELAAEQDRVLARLTSRGPFRKPPVTMKLCTCGLTLYVANTQSGGRIELEVDEKGATLVVAYTAVPGHGRVGPYTRFSAHAPRCLAAAARAEGLAELGGIDHEASQAKPKARPARAGV